MTRYIEAAILGALAEVVCHELYFWSTRDESSVVSAKVLDMLFTFDQLVRAADRTCS